ncbi:lactate utilization protein B [Porphyromonas pogonae]|uniref:lactate utilization protein B n=1 Tax=Porphyromonas pogonae TaxID=867595 RepID=UPI002E77100C|nr:LUD domain-containing protein [Porphyromonas pogonae]
MSTKHSKAAARFLENKAGAKWHDETLWMVRQKRDNIRNQVPEWENLRQLAHDIKRYNVTHLEELLQQFEENAKKNGVIVHWAKDAKEHNDIVYDLLSKHNVKKFVKSKSMLTEECHLNEHLIEKGINVIETDLGERILQLMEVPPSHIVLPAIHVKREEVSELFHEKWGTEKGNYDPTYLTHAARKSLREDFISADAAMTGGNFAVASTGEVVVCTNEGNADMGMSCQKLNICSFGLEKIVPDLDAVGVFTRLLARSATGQPSTTYTAHFRKPHNGGELHYIIVDNGRTDIMGNKDHVKILNCIRCGACMNTCPVYRRSGGYSYTYFIPGPLGVNLGMLKSPKEYSDNVSACTLCLSCSNVCPVMIDLGEQIYKWRQKLDGYGKANPEKKVMSMGMKFLMERPKLFSTSLKMAPIANHMPRFVLYNSINAWGKGRELPQFASTSFNSWWKKNFKK